MRLWLRRFKPLTSCFRVDLADSGKLFTVDLQAVLCLTTHNFSSEGGKLSSVSKPMEARRTLP